MASQPFPGLQEGLPMPPGPTGGFLDASRISGRAFQPLPDHWKGLPNLWEALPTTFKSSGRSPDLSWTVGMPSSPLSDLREDISPPLPDLGTDSQPHPDLWDCLPASPRPLGGPPGPSGGPPNHSRTFRRPSQPLPDLRKGRPTPPGPLGGTPRPSGGPPDHFSNSGRPS